MKIYQIDSSARKEGSTSRALAKKLLDKIKKPEDEIIYRDLKNMYNPPWKKMSVISSKIQNNGS